MKPAPGDVIANRFQLIRELGAGGMGSVWLADHLTLEVRCAVKFIAGEVVRDPKYLAQFHVEARTIAQVQSPHVVRVLDHDVCGDVPYIAMEFLEGEDLRTRLRREGRLDILETQRIVSQIARGLSKAHAAGIVHRDLKPENVFLVDEDGEAVVKLFDFGVAKWAAPRVASSSGPAEGLVGTPEYMSPEQTRGLGAVDHRADLWALAVIAYECLTGQPPFEGATMSELFDRINGDAPPVPSKVAPGLPPEVDAWWARAVAQRIDRRFQSARELAGAFGSALGVAESGASTSLAPIARTLPEGTPPVRPERSSHRRLRQVGYAVAAAGLMIAAALPLGERAFSRGPTSGVTSLAAHHAEEVPARAPYPALARIEVEGVRPAPAMPAQDSAGPSTKPSWRPPPALPRSARPSHARPSPKYDPDAVLGI